MNAPVVAFSRLTDQQYDAERAQLRALYGDSARERTGLYEQALAALFYRSGWTQEELAKREGRSQRWISYRLQFGRFLASSTIVLNHKNLTEGRFRDYFARTDSHGNERERFAAVAKLIQDETMLSRSTAHKPAIARAIKARFADGRWYKRSTIMIGVHEDVEDASEADVVGVLAGMINRGAHDVFCETQKGVNYRIVSGGHRKIDLVVLRKELGPIIDQLKVEGRKNMATMTPAKIAILATDLERTIDKLAHLGASAGPDAEE